MYAWSGSVFSSQATLFKADAVVLCRVTWNVTASALDWNQMSREMLMPASDPTAWACKYPPADRFETVMEMGSYESPETPEL